MFSRKLIPALLAWLLTTAALADGTVGRAAAGLAVQARSSHPLRCEIEVEDFGASVRLQGIVFAGDTAVGAYDMRVSGPGGHPNPEIRQQGDFAAHADRPIRLGIVELRKDSGGYNAVLTLVWNGAQYHCGRRIGEAWS
jgi:hypothetical protein